MARRASDTTEHLSAFSLHLPTAYKQLFQSLDPKSHSTAVRKLLRYALDNGALDNMATGTAAPTPMTLETAALPYLAHLCPDDLPLAARRCVRDHAQLAKLVNASDVVLAAAARALLKQPTKPVAEE